MSVHVDEIVTEVEVTDRSDDAQPAPSGQPAAPPADLRRLRQLEAERRRQQARLRGWGFDD